MRATESLHGRSKAKAGIIQFMYKVYKFLSERAIPLHIYQGREYYIYNDVRIQLLSCYLYFGGDLK